jgi:hypothetical protein
MTGGDYDELATKRPGPDPDHAVLHGSIHEPEQHDEENSPMEHPIKNEIEVKDFTVLGYGDPVVGW